MCKTLLQLKPSQYFINILTINTNVSRLCIYCSTLFQADGRHWVQVMLMLWLAMCWGDVVQHWYFICLPMEHAGDVCGYMLVWPRVHLTECEYQHLSFKIWIFVRKHYSYLYAQAQPVAILSSQILGKRQTWQPLFTDFFDWSRWKPRITRSQELYNLMW